MKNHIRKTNRQTSLLQEWLEKAEIKLHRVERFLLPGIAVACIFFVASCGVITRPFRAEYNSNSNVPNTNVNVAIVSDTSLYNEGEYKELLDKKQELEKLSLPVKLDPKAVIKGKVAFVENYEARDQNYDYISDARKAKSVDELETVFRILCTKGKFLGNYKDNSKYDSTRTVKGYGINCQVAMIDYRARSIVAQKSFSDNQPPEVISDKKLSGSGEYMNPPPKLEIERYLNNFLVDKPAPGMTAPDAKELVRLPVTVNLKPDAAIKGKIKIAQKTEEGPTPNFSSLISSTDEYGFPYEKLASKIDELETLIRIVCVKGNPIGKVEGGIQYSSKCEVSVIDYKTLVVVAQKIIENKTLDESPSAKSASRFGGWIVNPPKQEIEIYLKSLSAA